MPNICHQCGHDHTPDERFRDLTSPGAVMLYCTKCGARRQTPYTAKPPSCDTCEYMGSNACMDAGGECLIGEALGDMAPKPQKTCTCPKEVWMSRGCQCGAIKPYKRNN